MSASGGSIQISYGTGITVNVGALASGTMTAPSLVMAPSSNIITVQNLSDAYGNVCANKTYTLTGSDTVLVSGWSPQTMTSIQISTDSSGNGSVVTPAVNIDARVTYSLGSMTVNYNEWVKQNQYITPGYINGYAIDSAGNLWGWGDDEYGQLGLGNDFTQQNYPVGMAGNIISVAGGYGTTYALGSNGYVYAWGNGSNGEIGNGLFNNVHYRSQVYNISGITAIASGMYTAYALDSSGNVWAWGDGGAEELGNGTASSSSVPVQVSNLSGIVSIAAGSYTGYALDSSGHVWAWGNGAAGQLGNGSTGNTFSPVTVNNLSKIVAMSSEGNTAYALDSSGNVWAWGDGGAGQLGNGTIASPQTTPVKVSNISNIVSISSFKYGGYAIDSTGKAWAWGNGGAGALGNGTTTSPQTTPVQVSNLSNIVAIAGSQWNGYATDFSGKMWVWGGGSYGVLGNGTTNGSTTPVPVNQSGWICPNP